nr:DUF2101 family protein [Thermococcus sp. 18S1]
MYLVGYLTERCIIRFKIILKSILLPTPSENPPEFKFIRKLTKTPLTIHELLSLRLQIMFLLYLLVNLGALLLTNNPLYIIGLGILYLLYIRHDITQYKEFFIEVSPYRVFYYSIFAISFGAFLGYIVLKQIATSVYYYYGYLVIVFAVVMAFRWYFKQKYGRDYTYGVVEEIKGDVVKVFVHDDIAANVKPGHYWVDAVEDLEIGRVVKLIVEDRKLKGAVPTRIIEVYLTDQSSQSSTEPKEETE